MERRWSGDGTAMERRWSGDGAAMERRWNGDGTAMERQEPMIVKLEDTKRAALLFGNWKETLIWSCLQGIMGDVYADNQENPQSAMAVLGDFCFFAGRPDREMAEYKPERFSRELMIMVPQHDGWAELIADSYGSRAKPAVRFAMKKEGDIFDRDRLQSAVNSLHPEYTLRIIDQETFALCRSADWSRDLVSQFADYDMYERLGIGVVAFRDGMPVSGASSYARYKDGIEIEIDTREDRRRRGLAYACGAGLILECLERGLYPSWDAHNRWSAALAEKLGYHFDYEYPVFEIEGY